MFLPLLFMLLFFILIQGMKASFKKSINLLAIFMIAVSLTVGCTAEEDAIPKQEQKTADKSAPIQNSQKDNSPDKV